MDIVSTAIGHFTKRGRNPQPSRSRSGWQTIHGKEVIVLENTAGILATYIATNKDDEVERVTIAGIEYVGRSRGKRGAAPACPDRGEPLDISRAVVGLDGRLYCGR
jgi:hypothetical protein